MGNVTSLSPAQILPIEHYLEKTLPHEIWSKSKLKSHLGATRFMKVGQIEHEVEQSLVVKIFVIPDVTQNEKSKLEEELTKHEQDLIDVSKKLAKMHNCVPWSIIKRSEKAGFLIRQFLSRSLYDRLSTRPFLTKTEKKWIAYQLVRALVTIDEKNVVHGDLKCENILLTRDDWLLLTDFAPFKPTLLPSDNPADFTYFFDTSRRRAAYLAPERFMNKEDSGTFPKQNLDTPMDIFSAGCIIAELFNDGQPIFTYGDILTFTEGSSNPDISSLDRDVQNLVKQMIQRNPKDRPRAKDLVDHDMFPINFAQLYRVMRKYKTMTKQDKGFSGDDLIREFVDDVPFVLSLEKNECVIPLSMILTAMLNTDFQSTKFRSFKILKEFTKCLTHQSIFERIIPTMLKFTKCIHQNNDCGIDKCLLKCNDCRVRSKALLVLRDILANVDAENICERECRLFPDFLNDLSAHAKDHLFPVRRMCARIIGDIGEIAIAFAQRCTDSENEKDQIEHVKRSLVDTTANIMTDRSSEVKQEFLHFSVIKMSKILGKTNTGDIILKHMITYLNDKNNPQLRSEFYNVLPDVVSSIGMNGHSAEVLGALIKQGLVDSNELVILSALECFIQLIKLNLMSKYLALEVASEAAPLLLYPNPGILISATTFFAALAQSINTAERLVQLYPIILPFFKKANKASFDSVTSILTFLRPPLTRSVYDLILSQFNSFSELGKQLSVEDFISVLPKDPMVDVDTIYLSEYKDFDKLLRRIRNAGKFDHSDIRALELMSHFIAEQVKKVTHFSAVTKTPTSANAAINIENVEKDGGSRIRYYSSLQPDQSADQAVLKNLWDRPYFSRPQKNNTVEERYSQSRCALRVNVHQKRNAYKVKMVEDLMNVTLDWDTNTSHGEEAWMPKGRLLAHIHEHDQAVNQLSLNSTNGILVTASDDCSIRVWNTEQFCHHSKPSNYYKSRNNWHSHNMQKVKRSSFTEHNKIAAATNTALYFLDIECLKSTSGSIWMKHFDSKKDGIITDMITSPSIEDKGGIVFSTSFGHVIGLDSRSGKEQFRLNHVLRQGFITSICSDKRQRWVTCATSRGYITVFDLRFNLKCQSFQVSDQQIKINKIISHPTEPSHIAVSVDGNNHCDIWSLESALREYAFWASPSPPLSQTERDPSGHSFRSMAFTTDGNVLLTGGTDRRIRSWNLQNYLTSDIISQAATDQTEGLWVTVNYNERKLEGVTLVQENQKKLRVQHEESDWGLQGSPQGHWDSVSSLNVLQLQNQKLLLSASRDGVMKVWK